jgi:hypothetical protein
MDHNSFAPLREGKKSNWRAKPPCRKVRRGGGQELQQIDARIPAVDRQISFLWSLLSEKFIPMYRSEIGKPNKLTFYFNESFCLRCSID